MDYKPNPMQGDITLKGNASLLRCAHIEQGHSRACSYVGEHVARTRRRLEPGASRRSDLLPKCNFKACAWDCGIGPKGKHLTEYRPRRLFATVLRHQKLEMVDFGPIERMLHCSKLDRLQ